MHGTVPHGRRGALTILAALATSAVASACTAADRQFEPDGPHATVLEIVDGDTIDADVGGRRERIRLLGIDTPEIAHAATTDRSATDGECFGDEATAFTTSMIPPGTEIRLERDIVGRDHYGRLLAHVYVGDRYVNGEIVRHGYATPMFIEPNRTRRDVIVAAATAAEADDLGLWAACG